MPLNKEIILNRSIELRDVILMYSATPNQNWRKSNYSEEVLHTLQNWSRTIRCSFVSYSGQDTPFEEFLSLSWVSRAQIFKE